MTSAMLVDLPLSQGTSYDITSGILVYVHEAVPVIHPVLDQWCHRELDLALRWCTFPSTASEKSLKPLPQARAGAFLIGPLPISHYNADGNTLLNACMLSTHAQIINAIEMHSCVKINISRYRHQLFGDFKEWTYHVSLLTISMVICI